MSWYIWHGGIEQCVAVHTNAPTLDQLAYVHGWNPQDMRTAFVRVQKTPRVGPLSDKRRVSSVIQFDMSLLRDEDFSALSKHALDALAPGKPWPVWFDKKRFLHVSSKNCTTSSEVPSNSASKNEKSKNEQEKFSRYKVNRSDARFCLYWPQQRVRSAPMSWHEIRSLVPLADQNAAVPAAQHLHPTWPVVVPGFVSSPIHSAQQTSFGRSGSLKDRLLQLGVVLHSDALPKRGSDSCLIGNKSDTTTEKQHKPTQKITIVKALGTDTKHVQGDVFLAKIPSGTNSVLVALKRFSLSRLDCSPTRLSDPLSAALLQQPPFIERLVLSMCSELVRQNITQNLPLYYNWFYCTDVDECTPTQTLQTKKKSVNACACMYICAEYAPVGNLHAHLKRVVDCRLSSTIGTNNISDINDNNNNNNNNNNGANLYVDLSLRALFFQILAGTLALHRYCGVTHGDLRWENILLQEIEQHNDGHWHYRIDARDYYVVNSGGLVPVLWDFGVSRISHRGIDNPTYRKHYKKKQAEIGGSCAHRIDLQTLFYWPCLTDSLQKMMLEPFFDNALTFVRNHPTLDTSTLISHLFGSSAQFTTKPDSKTNVCLGSFSLDNPLDFSRVTPSLTPYFKRSINSRQ